MAKVQRATACLALTLLILPAHSLNAVAQSEKARPQAGAPTIDPKTLGGQFKDLNDPGSLGAPLRPPVVGIEPTGLGTLSQLCGQLKEAGASPDYCK
jgi:hypothetical protein